MPICTKECSMLRKLRSIAYSQSVGCMLDTRFWRALSVGCAEDFFFLMYYENSDIQKERIR